MRILIAIAVISLSVAGFIVVAGNVVWFGDTHTYWNYATYITMRTYNPSLYWRSAGYPMALIISGTIITGSLWYIVAVQAIASSAIPVMIYGALRRFSGAIAGAAASISIVSLAPYVWETTIYPDQIYITLLVAITALVIFFPARPRSITAYAMVVCCAMAYALRPVGLVLFFAVLIVLVFERLPIRHIIGCLAVMAATALLQHAYIIHYDKNPNSMLGRQLFYMAYFESGGIDRGLPNVRALETKSGISAENPTMEKYWKYFELGDTGEVKDDEFLITSISQFEAHPVSTMWIVAGNYASLMGGQSNPEFAPLGGMSGNQTGITDPPKIPEPLCCHRAIEAMNSWFVAIYRPTLIISVLLMVVGLFVGKERIERCASFYVFLLFNANVAPLAIFADGQFRYQSQSICVAMIGAGLSIAFLTRRISGDGHKTVYHSYFDQVKLPGAKQ